MRKFSMAFVLFFFPVVYPAMASSCVSPPSGIVGWWKGEANGNDSIGTNNAAVPSGVTYVPAEVGFGFNLNGNTNRIIVPDASQLNFGSNQDFSIEAWIKPLANPGNYSDLTGEVMTMVGKRYAPDFSTAVGYEMYLGEGRLCFQMIDSLGNGGNFYNLAEQDLRDGNFHHVAVTVQRNSTTGLRFYVDGQLIETFDPTAVQGTLSNTWPLRIGNHPTPGVNAFYHGIIDEVSLYHRALSASEIAAIYNAGSYGKCVSLQAPFIIEQPTNQTVSVGGTATFNVTAGGTAPLFYQWSFNGTNILGATNASLTLNNVQTYNAGNYAVCVTNILDAVDSTNAVLTVDTLPVADATATVPLVISVNGSNATVVLDGSRSSDADNDPLQYSWFATGSTNVLTNGIVAMITLPVGTNFITLIVSDGFASDSQMISVDVLTLSQAVERLIVTVNSDPTHTQSLFAILRAALASINRDDPTSAIHQLQAFQNQVKVQLAPIDADLAQTLIDDAQAIIDAIVGGGGSTSHLNVHAEKVNGKLHLNFPGNHGGTYVIEASSDLVNWEKIGVAKDSGNGEFTFDDNGAAQKPARYYRIVIP